MKSLFKQLFNHANQLVMAAAFEHQTTSRKTLRYLLCLNSRLKAILLYQGGFVRAAKQITDKRDFKDKTTRRIVSRINSINQALTHWGDFVDGVGVPKTHRHSDQFNDRVLMVVNSCSGFDKNGYAVRSCQLSKSLKDQSIEVDFCARFGYPWDMRGREDWSKEPIVECDEGLVSLRFDPDWTVGGPDPEYWRAYADYIKDIVTAKADRPGVLHAHSKYSNAIATVIAGRELGIPVIYEMRGLWHLTRAQREPTFNQSDFFQYEERLEVWAAELTDAVVVISATLKDWLIGKGVSKDKIQVIPNAVDLAEWEGVPKNLSFSDKAIKLAFMGSVTAYEGLGTVLKALKILVAAGHTATLDIYGDGRYREALENLSTKLKLDAIATFHGRVDKKAIREQIKNYHIYPVVRIDSELTRLIPPLKHLEPMLHSRVVLISALPALLKNVPDCVAEMAVPPNDPNALAERICQLVSQPDLVVEIGTESRDWVVSERNWSNNVLMYKELYSRICEAGIETKM